jgi:hypothetical protein
MTVVFLVSILGGLEYSQVINLQHQNDALSSTIATYSSSISELRSENQNFSSSYFDVYPAFLSHLSHLENRNISEVAEDYAPNATIVWFGDTQGLGGTYNTTILNGALVILIGRDTAFNFSIESSNATYVSGTALVTANLAFVGTANADSRFGNTNGTITMRDLYVHQSGGWMISREDWDFGTFNVQYAQGPG